MMDYLDGVCHKVFPIAGDGNCLFASLAHIVYGAASRGMEVRHSIVNYVVENWNRFEFFCHTAEGYNYNDKEEYAIDMKRRKTYGTSCEIQAAAEIFPYLFEVWRNGDLCFSFGKEHYPIKRLRFSGDLVNGHFDVYEIPKTESKTTLPKKKKSRRAKHQKGRERKKN